MPLIHEENQWYVGGDSHYAAWSMSLDSGEVW